MSVDSDWGHERGQMGEGAPDSPRAPDRLPLTGEEEDERVVAELVASVRQFEGMRWGSHYPTAQADYANAYERSGQALAALHVHLRSLRSQLSQAEGRIRDLEGQRDEARRERDAGWDKARAYEETAKDLAANHPAIDKLEAAEQALSQATREREEARRDTERLERKLVIAQDYAEEAIRDAARYRFLKPHLSIDGDVDDVDYATRHWNCVYLNGVPLCDGFIVGDVDEEIDKAIDAARQSSSSLPAVVDEGRVDSKAHDDE